MAWRPAVELTAWLAASSRMAVHSTSVARAGVNIAGVNNCTTAPLHPA